MDKVFLILACALAFLLLYLGFCGLCELLWRAVAGAEEDTKGGWSD